MTKPASQFTFFAGNLSVTLLSRRMLTIALVTSFDNTSPSTDD